MPTLLLVRHAQASFFGPTYDRLTDHGREQARTLGRHWLETGVRPGQLAIGPLDRHRETADLVGEEFVAAGCAWPEAELAEELNEHQGIAVVKTVTGFGSAATDAIHAGPVSEADRAGIMREYFSRYRSVLTDWATGEITVEGLESWREFRDRAADGMRRLTTDGGKERTIAAFTSGGFVSAGLGHLLDLDDRKVVEISFVVRNCSVAEVRFSERRRTLISFNVMPGELGGDSATFI